MEEILLKNKKNGMLVLLACIFVELLATAGTVVGAIFMETSTQLKGLYITLFVVSVVILSLAWFPLTGLKVLKPNEALVLTLFGKYIGTLKGEGFYAVNPFCVAVNPASKTKLNQSGDVGLKALTTSERFCGTLQP